MGVRDYTIEITTVPDKWKLLYDYAGKSLGKKVFSLLTEVLTEPKHYMSAFGDELVLMSGKGFK